MCIVFLISLNCVSVFSCSSLSFLKTALLSYLLGNLQNCMCWGSITTKLLWPFCSDIFIWIFIFLEVLNCYLPTLSNSHLLWSLLTDFGKELHSFSSTRVLRFSQTLFNTYASRFLLPLVAELLSFYAFTPSCFSTGQLLTAFLKALLNAQVYSLFVTHRLGSSFHTCLLAVCQNLLLLPSEAHTGSWPWDGGVCTCDAQYATGVHGPDVGTPRWGISAVHDSVRCIPLWYLLRYGWCSPSLSWLSILDWLREKLAPGRFLQSWEARHLLTHFHFVGRVMGWGGLCWHWAVPPWKRGNFKLFSHFFQFAWSWIFFCSTSVL